MWVRKYEHYRRKICQQISRKDRDGHEAFDLLGFGKYCKYSRSRVGVSDLTQIVEVYYILFL